MEAAHAAVNVAGDAHGDADAARPAAPDPTADAAPAGQARGGGGGENRAHQAQKRKETQAAKNVEFVRVAGIAVKRARKAGKPLYWYSPVTEGVVKGTDGAEIPLAGTQPVAPEPEPEPEPRSAPAPPPLLDKEIKRQVRAWLCGKNGLMAQLAKDDTNERAVHTWLCGKNGFLAKVERHVQQEPQRLAAEAKAEAKARADVIMGNVQEATGMVADDLFRAVNGRRKTTSYAPSSGTAPTVDRAAFADLAPAVMAQLFQSDFLIGARSGYAALQWLSRFLAPRAEEGGSSYQQRFDSRFTPLVDMMFTFYDSIITAAHTVEGVPGRTNLLRRAWMVGHGTEDGPLFAFWRQCSADAVGEAAPHCTWLLLLEFEQGMFGAYCRLAEGSAGGDLGWHLPDDIKLAVSTAAGDKLRYVVAWAVRSVTAALARGGPDTEPLLQLARELECVDRKSPEGHYAQVERHDGRLYRCTDETFEFGRAVELRIKAWLTEARLAILGPAVTTAVAERIIGDEEVIELFAACFGRSRQQGGPEDSALALLLSDLRARIVVRTMHSRSKYFTQELNEALECRLKKDQPVATRAKLQALVKKEGGEKKKKQPVRRKIILCVPFLLALPCHCLPELLPCSGLRLRLRRRLRRRRRLRW